MPVNYQKFDKKIQDQINLSEMQKGQNKAWSYYVV